MPLKLKYRTPKHYKKTESKGSTGSRHAHRSVYGRLVSPKTKLKK